MGLPEGKTMKPIEMVISILREYANETGTIPRSTSDLSPLEEWLLMRLARSMLTFKKEKK